MNPNPSNPPSALAMLGQFVAHTPVWVWGLLAALVALGLWQSRTQRVRPARLVAVPIGLGIFSIISVAQGFGLAGLLAWALGVAAAFALNATVLRWPGRAQREGWLFVIQGSWWPLAIILAIFVLRYALNVHLALLKFAPAGQTPATWVGPVSSVAFGLLSGLFAARAWRVWRLAR